MRSIKSSSRLCAAIVLTGAIFFTTPVALAVQDASGAGSSSTSNSSSTPPSDATQKTTQKPAAKLADRLTKYKSKQALKLATADELKLKGVCKAAQVKLKVTNTKTKTANTARDKIYTDIQTRLSAIITRLKDADIDTANLEATQTKLKDLIDQYNADYLVFKTDLADLSEMDCITDPTAFKAALLTARADRLTVVNDAKTIREYIPTVKTALEAAKQALREAKAQTQTTNKDTTNNDTTGGEQ